MIEELKNKVKNTYGYSHMVAMNLIRHNRDISLYQLGLAYIHSTNTWRKYSVCFDEKLHSACTKSCTKNDDTRC